MNKNRLGKGFTLVEVICALAILLVVLIPLYRTTIHTSNLQNKVELQFQANHLAQSEMERLMNEHGVNVGKNSFTASGGSGDLLYVETLVEALSDTPEPQPPSHPEWHLKLVFEIERVLLTPVNKMTVTGRNGEDLGQLYTSLQGWPPGEFLCELRPDSAIQFHGSGILRLSNEKVNLQGIDLSDSGKPNGDLKILCIGETVGSPNLYFDSAFPPQHKPKHIVVVDNRVESLKSTLWPGAARNLELESGTLREGLQTIRGYLLTVMVFESEDAEAGGQLVKLQSIRHELSAIW